MNGIPKCIIAAVLLQACCAPDVRADRIVFRNGRELEGVIREENETHVVIDIGVGSMTISRRKIASVERASGPANAELKEAWQRKYILHRKHVPAGLSDVAEAFRAVSRERDAARNAGVALRDLEARERELQRRVLALRKDVMDLSRAVAAASPEQDVAAYNALVMKSNGARASLTVAREERAALAKQREAHMSRISDYLDHLSEFELLVERARERCRSTGMSDRQRYFFNRLANLVQDFDGELVETSVETRSMGGSTVVSVLINDRAEGRFIVDTGAGHVTLSERFAGRAGIDLSDAAQTEARLADGQRVKARSLMLDAVQVGEARAENVAATILPSAVSDDIDGLLGMSFLRHFVVRLDGSSGRLVLRQFTPR